jgi:hypothetical protein
MKKMLTYAMILTPMAITWIHWGGFKNDMGTLLMSIILAFIIVKEIGEHSAKTGKETK